MCMCVDVWHRCVLASLQRREHRRRRRIARLYHPPPHPKASWRSYANNSRPTPNSSRSTGPLGTAATVATAAAGAAAAVCCSTLEESDTQKQTRRLATLAMRVVNIYAHSAFSVGVCWLAWFVFVWVVDCIFICKHIEHTPLLLPSPTTTAAAAALPGRSHSALLVPYCWCWYTYTYETQIYTNMHAPL